MEFQHEGTSKSEAEFDGIYSGDAFFEDLQKEWKERPKKEPLEKKKKQKYSQKKPKDKLAETTFEDDKKLSLEKLKEEDRSRAGKVDEDIVFFVESINTIEDLYTTSRFRYRWLTISVAVLVV